MGYGARVSRSFENAQTIKVDLEQSCLEVLGEVSRPSSHLPLLSEMPESVPRSNLRGAIQVLLRVIRTLRFLLCCRVGNFRQNPVLSVSG